MFIKVTNANKFKNGQPLIINVNSIVSVYSDEDAETKDKMTIIYSPYENLIWAAQETTEEIYALIKEALDGHRKEVKKILAKKPTDTKNNLVKTKAKIKIKKNASN